MDYNRDLVHSFGDYVQGYDHNYPKNNNIPRTNDCIYLQPSYTLQGGHELMDLAKGELIHYPTVDTCVMPRMVIARVEELYKTQGYKSLKLFNRKKEEMALRDIDLLMDLENVDTQISDDPGFLSLTLGELPPSGLLSGPDEDLDVDNEMYLSELAGLLVDFREDTQKSDTEVIDDVCDAPNVGSDGKEYFCRR